MAVVVGCVRSLHRTAGGAVVIAAAPPEAAPRDDSEDRCVAAEDGTIAPPSFRPIVGPAVTNVTFVDADVPPCNGRLRRLLLTGEARRCYPDTGRAASGIMPGWKHAIPWRSAWKFPLGS